MPFVNRSRELAELAAAARRGGLLVVFGRRRVGKTRLLTRWLQSKRGLYSQAIESAASIQLEQVFDDLRAGLTPADLTPKTWKELLALIGLQKRPPVLCLDEFPYLVASDPSLPSVLQRWLDHDQPKGSLLILSGSSTRMMTGLFLRRGAPLYGRARKLLHIKPMDYRAFCRACELPPANPESFACFSLVGGIPRYWEFYERGMTATALAEALFFGFAPYLEQEPTRVLTDEGVSGTTALSVLEAIGRGAEKTSEIAARLGTAQTNLSRPLQQLLDASVLERELPFGESLRSTKRTKYRVQDPTLLFWFRVYSPHRTRWRHYGKAEKNKLLRDHAAAVFEHYCRQQHPDAARYWEGNVEFDFVRYADTGRRTLIVSEVKWKKLSPAEREKTERHLRAAWRQSTLSAKYPSPTFEILDSSTLEKF